MILSDIRTQVRQRANLENSNFVTDPELNLYINASYGELFDLLVSRFEDYFIKLDVAGKPPQVTVASGSAMIPLPTDLYKLRGLDRQVNGPSDWSTVPRFTLPERNARSHMSSRLRSGMVSVSYRILGQFIEILPAAQAPGVYQLWYVPRLSKLVADSDDTAGTTLDFEEYIIVDSAVKCLIKEESDPSALMAIKEQLKARVLAMSANRDAGAPERVSDVSGFGADRDYTFPY